MLGHPIDTSLLSWITEPDFRKIPPPLDRKVSRVLGGSNIF